MIYGLSNWQDGSSINRNGETGWRRRLWEEDKGFSIRCDSNQIPKQRCHPVGRLTTVEFRGEE